MPNLRLVSTLTDTNLHQSGIPYVPHTPQQLSFIRKPSRLPRDTLITSARSSVSEDGKHGEIGNDSDSTDSSSSSEVEVTRKKKVSLSKVAHTIGMVAYNLKCRKRNSVAESKNNSQRQTKSLYDDYEDGSECPYYIHDVEFCSGMAIQFLPSAVVSTIENVAAYRLYLLLLPIITLRRHRLRARKLLAENKSIQLPSLDQLKSTCRLLSLFPPDMLATAMRESVLKVYQPHECIVLKKCTINRTLMVLVQGNTVMKKFRRSIVLKSGTVQGDLFETFPDEGTQHVGIYAGPEPCIVFHLKQARVRTMMQRVDPSNVRAPKLANAISKQAQLNYTVGAVGTLRKLSGRKAPCVKAKKLQEMFNQLKHKQDVGHDYFFEDFHASATIPFGTTAANVKQFPLILSTFGNTPKYLQQIADQLPLHPRWPVPRPTKTTTRQEHIFYSKYPRFTPSCPCYTEEGRWRLAPVPRSYTRRIGFTDDDYF